MATNSLPSDALVVRGGECNVNPMKRNAQNHEAKNPGIYALSGWCVPGLDADATARHAREQGESYLPQHSMRTITVGDLEAEGFAVVPDEPPPGHVAIMLSSPLSTTELERLHGMFGPIIANPVAL